MNKELKIFKTVLSYQNWISEIKKMNPSIQIGFVPTMGALHEGHLTLMKESQKNCDLTIASIFVNPTQFNNSEDLQKYPRTLETDYKLLNSVEVDAVFCPDYQEIYKDNYTYKVTENKVSKILCGAHRPGHFDGVLTVVLKLLNIIQPQHAFFGLKDYQQFYLIREMIESLFIPIKIHGVETIRNEKGLALSSRNSRLSSEGLKKAELINQILKEKFNTDNSELAQEFRKLKFKDLGIELDYLEEHFGRRFFAGTIENVRLIDNVSIT